MSFNLTELTNNFEDQHLMRRKSQEIIIASIPENG